MFVSNFILITCVGTRHILAWFHIRRTRGQLWRRLARSKTPFPNLLRLKVDEIKFWIPVKELIMHSNRRHSFAWIPLNFFCCYWICERQNITSKIKPGNWMHSYRLNSDFTSAFIPVNHCHFWENLGQSSVNKVRVIPTRVIGNKLSLWLNCFIYRFFFHIKDRHVLKVPVH